MGTKDTDKTPAQSPAIDASARKRIKALEAQLAHHADLIALLGAFCGSLEPLPVGSADELAALRQAMAS